MEVMLSPRRAITVDEVVIVRFQTARSTRYAVQDMQCGHEFETRGGPTGLKVEMRGVLC